MNTWLRKLSVGVAAFCALVLTGCATDIQQYANKTPAFSLMEYFDGQVHAWGMVENRSGEVTRRFTVDIRGTRKANTIILDEYFLFDDGEKQFRQWKIEETAPNQFTGTASDVIGSASGVSAGNALRWQYVLRVPVDGSTYDIHFDDWMYRLDDQRVFNKAEMTKFGLKVGAVTLFFEKTHGP